MGIKCVRLSEGSLNGILQTFDTFRPDFVIRKSGTKTETLSAIFEFFWRGLTKDGRYINDFKILKKSVGWKVCSVARTIGLVLIIQPEARARDPVAVEYENTATLLTGIVDYAILSSVHREAAAELLCVELDAVEDSG